MTEATSHSARSDFAPVSLRLDKWLWYARFFKTRSLATAVCRAGKVRLNKMPVHKSSQSVRVGDILTFSLGSHIRVIRIVALTGRRGSAPEAALLYQDMSPPVLSRKSELPGVAQREPGSGRPTKRERRETDRLRDG